MCARNVVGVGCVCVCVHPEHHSASVVGRETSVWEGVCGREPADRVKKSGEIRDSLEHPGPLFLVVVTEGGSAF